MLTETVSLCNRMNPSDVGIVAACVANGINPSDFVQIQGFRRGLEKSAEAADLGRMVAGLAHDVLLEAGEGELIETHIYGELAKSASWSDMHFELVAPVYRALDTVMRAMEKQAAEGGGGLLSEAGKWVVGGGMLGGGALGSLYWLLNRQATTDDAHSESLQSRTDLYKRMAREIRQELANTTPVPVRRALKKQVEEPVLL